MKKIFLTFLIFGLAISNSVFSQSESSNSKKSLSLGIHTGFCSGVGASIKKDLGEKYAVEFTLLPPLLKDGKVLFSSAGLSGYYKFTDSKYLTTFSYLSLGDFYWQRENETYDYITNTYETKLESINHLNSALGLGFGLKYSDISFNFMVGYGLYTSNEGRPSTFITGEFSFMFYIK